MKPSVTGSVTSINYPSATTGGLNSVAQQTTQYAIRFSGGLQHCPGQCHPLAWCALSHDAFACWLAHVLLAFRRFHHCAQQCDVQFRHLMR